MPEGMPCYEPGWVCDNVRRTFEPWLTIWVSVQENMHELSIAMSIVEMAQEEEAAKHGGVQVTAIHLKLGALSGVVKEALVSAYEMAREDTPLQGAALVIEEVPVMAFVRKMPGAACGGFGAIILLCGMRHASR